MIKNVSCSVNPGEMIALAGPSGGGKTTIFSLIERFYEPSAGEIKIGELPITAMSMKAWRSQIGYVSQESSMMAGTIRANLTYGLENATDIKDTQLWEVAKMSYADQFIKEFSNGVDTEVGERSEERRVGKECRAGWSRKKSKT